MNARVRVHVCVEVFACDRVAVIILLVVSGFLLQASANFRGGSVGRV